MTQTELTTIIGKKLFFEDNYTLAGSLDYINGIPIFDDYLAGKTLKQINAVIHIAKYPKGLAIKIQKNFSSISFGLSYQEIRKTILSDTSDNCNLVFEKLNGTRITFSIKPSHIFEVRQFLDDIGLQYHLNGESQRERKAGKEENGNYQKSQWQQEEKYKYQDKHKRESNSENNSNQRMTREKALSILGLKITANNDEIKQSYRSLVKKYNTDHRNNFEEHVKDLLEEKMKEINRAKDYLLK